MYNNVLAIVDIDRKEMLECSENKEIMKKVKDLCLKNPKDTYVLFKPHVVCNLKQEIILSPLEEQK